MNWSEMTQDGPAAAPEPEPGAATAPRCPTCTVGRLAREQVNTSFWIGRRLVIVENVPALVCRTCSEQFYEDETAMTLDLMRGAGFPESRAARFASVPVFAFAAGRGDRNDAR